MSAPTTTSDAETETAAEVHTGGMVALVPADPGPLTVDGGLPADELHLTLVYLGDDVTAWSDDQTGAVQAVAAKLAAAQEGPITARVMGHATFNPDGGDDGSRTPCAVYQIGDSADIVPLQAATVDALTAAKVDLPEQYTPYLPHITAASEQDASALTFTGPVTFDLIRVALGGDVTDYPLGAPDEPGDQPAEDAPVEDAVTAAAPAPVPAPAVDSPADAAMATAADVMAAPVIEAPDAGPAEGEWRVRFPVMAIEGFDTSDGRYLTPGAFISRALPMTILAQPFSSHGGAEPPYAVTVGRLDKIERVPGPTVTSRVTREPFPEGTFVWVGHGVIDPTIDVHGLNIGNLLKRRFLNGASVDLAGLDAELVGEEGGLAVDPDNPRRLMIAHRGEQAAITLVPIPAFGDAYVELVGDDEPFEPVNPDELPEGFCASAAPAWHSAEVGDYPTLVAAADAGEWSPTVTIPADAADQLAEFIASGEGEQRDAPALAADIVDYIGRTWTAAVAQAAPVEASPGEAAATLAAADEPAPVEGPPVEVGTPDEPQTCALCLDAPAVVSLLFVDRDDNQMFVPACEADTDAARAAIEQEGYEVTDTVPVPAADEKESAA